MAATDQFFTLAGVALGAASSYLVSTLGEHARDRRDVARAWQQKKLESYARYVSDVKHMYALTRRIAASAGLTDRPEPLTREVGLPLLAEAEVARGMSTEIVALIGGAETVAALREVNRRLWRLERFARGLLGDDDREGWEEAVHAYMHAINVFHECARRDLGVPGEYRPRNPETPPPDRVEDDRARSSRSSSHLPPRSG